MHKDINEVFDGYNIKNRYVIAFINNKEYHIFYIKKYKNNGDIIHHKIIYGVDQPGINIETTVLTKNPICWTRYSSRKRVRKFKDKYVIWERTSVDTITFTLFANILATLKFRERDKINKSFENNLKNYKKSDNA